VTVPAKVPLILAPTPLHRLAHASADLGIDLWIKRDDLTGFAVGGNKGRKLEYLLAAAIEAKADVVVTCGSAQSNFIRQLGAASAIFGLRCAAVVMPAPFSEVPPSGPIPLQGGNLILDEILGVELHRAENGTWAEIDSIAERLAIEFEQAGKTVYRIPFGGSSPLGAFALFQAGEELKHQGEEPFERIVFGSSSGSTQVGLATSFFESETRVLGVACDPEPEMADDFAKLSSDLSDLTGLPKLKPSDFEIDFGFIGPGYGVPSEDGMNVG
jgi:1-aminocyclopropane-1-carboxylate deaminase/D-cysteine desulfhydrase-like pyridoxal-dependent ACC family enzyme